MRESQQRNFEGKKSETNLLRESTSVTYGELSKQI